MKHDAQRRQIVNLEAMPTAVREAVRTAKGKPIAVTVPKAVVPRTKGVKVQ